MVQHPPANIESAAARFAIDGELRHVEPLHRGHIHDTFVSTWTTPEGERRFLHQRMNDAVFQDIDGLMHNVERITRHLRQHTPVATGVNGDEEGLDALQLVPTQDGASFLRADDGPWRTYHFIDGTESHDRPRDAQMAREAARAFGDFQARLELLPAAELVETIPRFFSSPYRLEQLTEARDVDVADRVKLASSELAMVDERLELVSVMEDRLNDGRIPARVVHGDTKLNNVLFDRATGHPRCIVDLDTCMPGYSLYDFGDLVRFTAAKTAEDEPDLSRVGVDVELYDALVEGYLAGAGNALNEEERNLMPTAARLVTMTIGMRFLADYLAGDVYFKTDYDDHNLVRARVQLRMVEEMERVLP